MKKMYIILIILLTLTIIHAQQNQIKLSQTGYGSTSQIIRLSVHNTGDNNLNKLMFYLDGELVRTSEAMLTSKAGIRTSFVLEPGEHLIEVKTSEGAYDSLKVTIQPIFPHQEEYAAVTQRGDVSFIESNNFKIIIGLAIVIVVIIWLFMKKPKLEL